MNNIVVYVGVEVFDIIIYLGQILSKLGRKILIIDHSETKLLSNSLPTPVDISCSENLIRYHDIEFTTLPLSIEMMETYDDILIACGFNEAIEDIINCNRLIYVTDLYRNNSQRLKDLAHDKNCKKDILRSLLIKSRYDITVDPLVIGQMVDEQVLLDNISIILYEDKEERKKLISHHNMSFNLKGISRNLKTYLIEEIRSFIPGVEKKELSKAMRTLR